MYLKTVFPILFWTFVLQAPLSAQYKLARPPEFVAVADSMVAAGQVQTALSLLQQVGTQLTSAPALDSTAWFYYLKTLGLLNFEQRIDIPESRRLLETALQWAELFDPSNKAERAYLMHILGKTWYFKGYPGRAVPYFEKSLPLWLDSKGENDQNTARCYNALAICYNHFGNYEKSIACGLKAVRCLKKAVDGDPTAEGVYLYNIGLTYVSKGDAEEALRIFQEALAILEPVRGDHEDTALCLSLLGTTHAALGNGPPAVEYQWRALRMFQKISAPDDGYIASCYKALAAAYGVEKKWAEAETWYQKALYFNVGKEGVRAPAPEILVALAQIRKKSGNYPAALLYLDSALLELNYARPLQYKQLKDRQSTYWALHHKATILTEQFAAGACGVECLRQAGDLLADAKTVMLNRIADFYQVKNKLVFYRRAMEGYAAAIGVYGKLFETTGNREWLNEAFEYSETGKSLLLYQSFLQSKSQRKFRVPTELVAEEESLLAQITEVEKAIFQIKPEETGSRKDSLQEKLFRLKTRFEELRKSIVSTCPDYYIADYGFPHENIPAVQSGLLDEHTAMLEYFHADSVLYAFLIRRDTLAFRRIAPAGKLARQVADMREGMYAYFSSAEKSPELYRQSAGQYAQNAADLYDLLVRPFQNLLPEKIIIVPDGVLGYLPFEALLREKPQNWSRFQQYAYFGRDHVLSYTASAALLREIKNRPASSNSESLIALAPFYRAEGSWSDSLRTLRREKLRSATLYPLDHSGEEVFKIARKMKGEALAGGEADKNAFLVRAGRYRILHLATHARADDKAGEYSWLAFPPKGASEEAEKLYAADIYGLKLDADLVTLSACETGLGQLYKGEGIVGLARAFTAAGAKSIVYSLWTVDDAKTRILMDYFYGNLQKGLPKDVALAEAKRSFLSRFKGEDAHPFFWSGFVPAGDMRALR